MNTFPSITLRENALKEKGHNKINTKQQQMIKARQVDLFKPLISSTQYMTFNPKHVLYSRRRMSDCGSNDIRHFSLTADDLRYHFALSLPHNCENLSL